MVRIIVCCYCSLLSIMMFILILLLIIDFSISFNDTLSTSSLPTSSLPTSLSSSSSSSRCEWKHVNKPNSPEFFWVNMDKSTDRRKVMEDQLNAMGVRHYRVRAVANSEIYIPPDIEQSWVWPQGAKFESSELPPSRLSNANTKFQNYTSVITGLFGRRKSNRIKELGCTLSHIVAMQQAIESKTSTSKYAVITEDDIHFPLDIDFDLLVASAPRDFSVLQLFNSNEATMLAGWISYTKRGQLWTERFPNQPADFWSTCAFLINKEVIAPILNKIFIQKDGWMQFKILAGLTFPCGPQNSMCCPPNQNFVHNPPCVLAPRGYQADSYIYSLNKSYVLNIPTITNGMGGNKSTLHQDHVENFHAASFKRQRIYINDLLSKNVEVPSFLKSPCDKPQLLQTEFKIVKEKLICKFDMIKRHWNIKNNIMEIYWVNFENSTAYINTMMDHYKTVGIDQYVNRIPAISLNEVFIPDDVLSLYETAQCVVNSNAIISEIKSDKKYIVTGACGRGKGQNTLNDLTMTMTHLLAIHKAIYSTKTTNRFALIIEDDIEFHLDIDFDILLKTAPHDFGILQLTTANEHHVNKMWWKYNTNLLAKADGNYTWIPSQQHAQSHNIWASSAYIIDRVVMKPIIDKIMNKYKKGNLLDFKIIAGIIHPCAPSECCCTDKDLQQDTPTVAGQFKCTHLLEIKPPPCFKSRGFHSSSFLYSIAPSYTLQIPIFVNGYNNTFSNFNMARIDTSHKKGFIMQRNVINDIAMPYNSKPNFILHVCNKPLENTFKN